MEVNAVSVKLPIFWPQSTAVLLIQAEAQFESRGITSDYTKYYHVTAALDSATDKYKKIKRAAARNFHTNRIQMSCLTSKHARV